MVYRGGKYPEKANGGSSVSEAQRSHDAAAPQTVGPAEPAKSAKAKRKPGRIWAAALASAAAICLVCGIAIFGIQPTQPNAIPGSAASTQAASQAAHTNAGSSADPNKNASGAQSAAPTADDLQEATPDTAAAQTTALEYRPIDDPQAFHGAEYRTGAVLVSFKEGMDPQEALAQLQAETGIDGITCVDTASDYVELALPDNISVKDAKEQFARCTVVDAVQPNFVYHAMEATGETASQNTTANANADKLRAALATALGAQHVETNDPFLKLGETDTYGSLAENRQWWLESVHAYEAWSIAKGQDGGDNAVIVAVIDDSINPNHEDLKDNIVKDKESGNIVAYNAVAGEPYNDVATLSSTSSTYDHGTHVAGIVAAEANNGIGVAGVSYNAHILPIHAGDGTGVFSADAIIDAYDYILKNKSARNIRVINLSVGAYWGSNKWGDDALIKKIDEAWEAGIVTVTAAGNNISGHPFPYRCYPGDYNTCVNVINLERASGTGSTEVKRNSASNHNTSADKIAKDISAPGTSIFSTINGTTGYKSMTGTSMATPCVSGIMALIFTSDPSLESEQAVNKLYATASDLNDPKQYGYGEANASKALNTNMAALAGTTSITLESSATLSFTGNQTGTWTWTSSNPNVVKVSGDKTGVTYTGNAPGNALICGTNGSTKAAATVSVYDTSSQNATIEYGSSVELELPADNPENRWTWSSSNKNIVRVEPETGVATALSMSSNPVTVTATLKANPSIKIATQITITKADLSSATVTATANGSTETARKKQGDLYLSNRSYTGSPITFDSLALKVGECTLPLEKQTFYTATYANNTNAGVASITFTAKQGAQIPVQGSKTVYFRIIASSVSNCSFTYTKSYECTGNPINLSDLKVVYNGKKELKQGSDYTVTYQNNVSVGTGYATIKGKGNCNGTRTLSFTITPAAITQVKLAQASYAYNGTARKPAALVYSGSKLLQNGTDYVVSYSRNVNAGTAAAAIRGVGNYTGYELQNFTITKASNALTAKAKTPKVKLAKVRKANQVIKRSKALTVSKARGTVTYSKVSGSKRLTIAKKTGNITVKRGTPRGTYSIKVKVRAAGTANYKAKTKTVTIKVRVR